MALAKVIEITSESTKGFEDAIQQGIAAVRAGKACVIDMRVLPGYDTRA